MGTVGVGNVSITQVAVEASLVNRGQRSQPHDHTGKLPEVRHPPRMWVGWQTPAGVGDLLTGTIHLLLTETTLQIGPSADTRRSASPKQHRSGKRPGRDEERRR